MRAEELLDIIGEAAEDGHVLGAAAPGRAAKWWAAGACVAAAACVAAVLLARPAPQTPAEQGGTGHGAGSVFMSYAGPILPLTTLDEDCGILAERRITLDFSALPAEIGTGSAGVADEYLLQNPQGSPAQVTALYPVSGNFQAASWPTVLLNGSPVEYELIAGPYSGGFVGAGGASQSMNLKNIGSWEGYQELLEGGYLAQALAATPELERQVTVYTLSELSGGEGVSAATLCMSFEYDPEKTEIFTYGFNGGSNGEAGGSAYRDFFLRHGLRREDEQVKYLVVAGEDIAGYELQGYLDGSCTPGQELEGVSARVERRQCSMAELLKEISLLYFSATSGAEFSGDHNRHINEAVSFGLFYQAVCRHFAEYGPWGSQPKERYGFGMLEDIVHEAVYHRRVFYLAFELNLPAGGSANVCIRQQKPASFDFACTGEDLGVEGYDLLTYAGSTLEFTAQYARITGCERLEIVRQNFGFDPGAGVTEVALAPNGRRYYIEVRAAG